MEARLCLADVDVIVIVQPIQQQSPLVVQFITMKEFVHNVAVLRDRDLSVSAQVESLDESLEFCSLAFISQELSAGS